MKQKDIDYLLVVILNGSASREDILRFEEWIKDYDNEQYFTRFREMWHLYMHEEFVRWYKENKPQAVVFSGAERDPDLKRFLNYIRVSRKREKRRLFLGYSGAAAAVIILLFGLFSINSPFRVSSPFDADDFSKLSYSSDSVKVELYDGQVVKSIKGISGSVSDLTATLSGSAAMDGSDAQDGSAVSDGSRVSEPAKSKIQAERKYNSVTTPPGERAAMVLSDGTRVYLTANSYLRYPAKFGTDSRDVTLVGRGYFEVEKSNVPFRVKTSDMEIEVLGTSFDVESRSSGNSSSVILVEGSVKILSEGREQMLSPDEQASLDRKTKKMDVKRVDSKLLTMWKDGVLIVHGQSFNELIGSLSSWYGVNIIDKTSVLESEKFNGRFDREDIEAAIKAVCISAKIEYRIEDGNLILEDL